MGVWEPDNSFVHSLNFGENVLEFMVSSVHTSVQLDTNQLDKAEILITSSRFTNNHYI